MKEHIGEQFDRYYCSEFTRAKETAGLLGLDHAEWLLEFYLRERDKGVFNGHSWAERQRAFKDEMRFRESGAYGCSLFHPRTAAEHEAQTHSTGVPLGASPLRMRACAWTEVRAERGAYV